MLSSSRVVFFDFTLFDMPGTADPGFCILLRGLDRSLLSDVIDALWVVPRSVTSGDLFLVVAFACIPPGVRHAHRLEKEHSTEGQLVFVPAGGYGETPADDGQSCPGGADPTLEGLGQGARRRFERSRGGPGGAGSVCRRWNHGVVARWGTCWTVRGTVWSCRPAVVKRALGSFSWDE